MTTCSFTGVCRASKRPDSPRHGTDLLGASAVGPRLTFDACPVTKVRLQDRVGTLLVVWRNYICLYLCIYLCLRALCF